MSLEWINTPTKELIHSPQPPLNTLYFLYGFLGDDFEIVREDYLKNVQTWKRLNPDFSIKIIRESYDGIDHLVRNKFPRYYPMYASYPKDIQRCDIFRYMLMFLNGGVYSDLDVVPNISIQSIIHDIEFQGCPLSWANIIFGIGRHKDINKCRKATKLETIRGKEPEIPVKISNYFFIARMKRHPIWIDILKLAKKRSLQPVKSQYGIIYSTGPDLVTTALSQNRKKYNDIAVIPYDDFQRLLTHEMSGSWRDKGFRMCESEVDIT